MTLLRAAGVARSFGDVEALAPTDVELAGSECLALVGPNGAGKSTLLAILAGALEPTAGSVESGARVGWVPQRPAHYGRLTVRENLELFARLAGVQADLDAMLARFGLPGGRLSGDLSVGNRQRLNIALSLLDEPDVLLLDEPTASLDPEQRQHVWELVASVRERGGAVCFATHDLAELAHATRVLTLQEGRVV